MLLGGDFNTKAKQLLVLLATLSENNPEEKVPVKDLVDELDLDRSEFKNLLEYLDNKELITIATIGGPFLYGHISITAKGIAKIGSI